MKQCPNCKAEVGDAVKFCSECGFNIKQYEEENAAKICPQCGAAVEGMKFCAECGCRIGEAPAKALGAFSDDDFGLALELTNQAVEEKKKDEAKAEKLRPFAPFEYEEHSDGTYTVTGLKEKTVLRLVVPQDVVDIADHAFENGEFMQIELPEGLMKIGRRAFAGCLYMEEIALPASLRVLGDEAFADCTALTLEIPDTVTVVGEDVLRNTLPDKIRQKEEARKKEEEEKIKEFFDIVDGCLVKYKGDNAEVTIPKGVNSIGTKAFYGKKNLTTVIVPDGVVIIRDSAFDECSNLLHINFPRSVKIVGDSAFKNTNLSSVVIPKEMEYRIAVYDPDIHSYNNNYAFPLGCEIITY